MKWIENPALPQRKSAKIDIPPKMAFFNENRAVLGNKFIAINLFSPKMLFYIRKSHRNEQFKILRPISKVLKSSSFEVAITRFLYLRVYRNTLTLTL